MLIVYNFFQLIFILLFLPLLLAYFGLRSKYRNHLPTRLGFGLKHRIPRFAAKKRTIWIHALSVGEVNSALPHAAALHKTLKDTDIIFSSTTKSGYDLARKLLEPYCRAVIPSPVDLLPICKYYIHFLRPDMFILVETDFWPNLLHQLQKRDIPILLVNGRVSSASMKLYNLHKYLFRPMFLTLSRVCTQTESDLYRFIELGVPAERIVRLGNLKYEPTDRKGVANTITIPGIENVNIFVAGSTHAGEEEILLNVFEKLQATFPLKLIIAPRNPKRAAQIAALAKARGIGCQFRSENDVFTSDLLLLDTIGELSSVYGLADISFVGGSLVDKGGHNPLEPASRGVPVMFGKYMSDFEEISQELVACGGGLIVANEDALLRECCRFLEDPDYLRHSGSAANDWVAAKRGVLRKHVELIEELI